MTKYINTLNYYTTCEVSDCTNQRKRINGKAIGQYCNHHTRRLVTYGDPVLEMPVLSHQEVQWLNHHYSKALMLVDESRIQPLHTLISRYKTVGIDKAVRLFTTTESFHPSRGFYKGEVQSLARRDMKSLESFIGGCVVLFGEQEMIDSFIKAELRTRLILEPHLYSYRMQTTHWLSYAFNQEGYRLSDVFRRPTQPMLGYFTVLRERHLTRIVAGMLFGGAGGDVAGLYSRWCDYRKQGLLVHPDMPHLR